jgi:hypothetical protein
VSVQPKPPSVDKPTLTRAAAPPVYRPQQTQKSGIQLKPSGNFSMEARPAPPVYRPQPAVPPSIGGLSQRGNASIADHTRKHLSSQKLCAHAETPASMVSHKSNIGTLQLRVSGSPNPGIPARAGWQSETHGPAFAGTASRPREAWPYNSPNVVQRVAFGVWNARNLSNLSTVKDEILEQIAELATRDENVILHVTEVLAGGTNPIHIRQLKTALERKRGGTWTVRAIYVGRTGLGGRREYMLEIANFPTRSRRLSLPGGSDYRSALISEWESEGRTPRRYSVGGYHAFGPGNPDRAPTTTAVRGALKRDQVDVTFGDWNINPPPLSGYSILSAPGATTAGGNQYDFALVRDAAPIGASEFQSGSFRGSDHRLIRGRIGERSGGGRLRYTKPRYTPY